MAKRKEFVVIGLGRFGMSVIDALIEQDQIVTALDINKDLVERIANRVTLSACIDSTDEESLRDIGIKNADFVIVAIGSDAEASFMTLAVLKEMNINNVIVKSSNLRMSKILEKIGADQIINPDLDSGKRLALRLLQTSNVEEIFTLDKNHSLVYVRVQTDKFQGKDLSELNIRDKYAINIVAIKREDKVIIPSARDQIVMGDVLIVVGTNGNVSRFEIDLEKE